MREKAIHKKPTKTMLFFVGMVILFWLSYQANKIFWVRGCDNVSSVLRACYMIALLTVGVLGIVVLLQLILQKNSILLKAAFLLIIVGHMWGCYQIREGFGNNVSAAVYVVGKGGNEGERYIEIPNLQTGNTIMVKCDEGTYESVTPNDTELRSINYRYLNRDKKIGYLIFLK